MRRFAAGGFVLGLVAVGTGSAQPPAQPPALTADIPRLTPRASFKLPSEVASPANMVSPLLLSADGSRLAVGVADPGPRGAVQVWSLRPQPKLVAEFAGGTYSYALSPSGKRLVSAGMNELYDVDTKRALTKLYGFTHVFFRDDATAVATSRSFEFAKATSLELWDVTKGAKPAATIPVPDNRFEYAIPAKGGREVWLYWSEKGEVECYDLDARALRHTIRLEREDPTRPVIGVYPSATPDGTHFAYSAGRWLVHDAATGKIVMSAPPDLHSSPAGFLPTGTRYFAIPAAKKGGTTGYHDRDCVVYDWKAQKAVAALTGLPPRPPRATMFEPAPGASADGKTVVIAARSGEVLVFDMPDVK